ncbi:hypothetical protein E8E11_000940 [Didymella keratinophila]|nr:hypothetical protein E8E11_000940 [Didymella keratinophila]
MAAADQAWGRRLIVCCDGTWQSSVTEKENIPSNVTKLARLIKRIGQGKNGKMWHQVVYYDGGVGTGNLSKTEGIRQGGTGAGLVENIIEAYNFIVLNWQPGDEIFCFGFSRGAYTARAVAGLVTDIGVIQPNDMQYFPEVYQAYMSNSKGGRFRESKAWIDFRDGVLSPEGQRRKDAGERFPGLYDFAGQAQMWQSPPHAELAISEESRQIKVIGVWDTVGSLGVPDIAFINNSKRRAKYGFHNVQLSSHVEHAYHALALDERRKAFRPTLWYIPKALKGKKNEPELKQVWFPGVHINVGGGSDDAFDKMEGDLENISVATLTWMLQCIAPHLDIDQDAFQKLNMQYRIWLTRVRYACTYHHEATEGWGEYLWKKVPDVPFVGEEPDPLKPPRRDPLHEHEDLEFGWGLGPIADSFTEMYALNGTHPRCPGFEQTEMFNKTTEKYGWVNLSDLGETNEYIHPLVFHRKTCVGWHEWTTKHPLADWERTFANGRWWWHRKTDKDQDGDQARWLPEWVIHKHTDAEINYERSWYTEAVSMEQQLSKKTSLEKVKKVTILKKPKNKRVVEEVDFLEKLDGEVDFANVPETSWP